MKKVICLLILLPLIIIGQTQQYSYGPYNADLRASVWENYSGTPIYEGSLKWINTLTEIYNGAILFLPQRTRIDKVLILQ